MAHLLFCNRTKPNKKSKRATKPTHHDTSNIYAVTRLQDNEVRRTTWWLEPGAYFFDFERKGQVYTLTIIETDDLHDETAENKQLMKITGEEDLVIKPFRIVLRQFSSQTYEENHWPYNLNKTKIKDL